MKVTYKGGSTEVYVPFDSTYAVGATCPRGVPTDVPDDIAGHPPGSWRPTEPGEVGEGSIGFTVTGWPLRLAADEQGNPALSDEGGYIWETHDPGAGLLAQPDVWEKSSRASSAKEGDAK